MNLRLIFVHKRAAYLIDLNSGRSMQVTLTQKNTAEDMGFLVEMSDSDATVRAVRTNTHAK
jgi:hypothetical protein